ncbi:Short chain dehydrogenase [Schizosaccharomyces pombe]|uniref:Uncharacterized oxidoreductase C736.13 n=1 Tax=Schizosaccharomyces pombe (strain 972 / ATCC 24843) TaxID=284812 RepID=YJCD_SCHPO|nr:putative dehydrogenase [Schizosaccharomyces pombe]O74959.1 RecName: Full=Uncharacterized oxidoreductase C736.13 [Schizosaccharomyces pombe 972h-]CAA19277.1 short chain dehydrogenase (predicted) [Schizosaccharomyces pombe]|eukprot:NP_587784.1 putative dehydrogenase [Schizosaccharomyces pombe]
MSYSFQGLLNRVNESAIVNTLKEYTGLNTPKWTFNDIPDLTGKVALVTGSSGGIGYVTALELARKGAKVYLAGRNEEKYQKVMKQIHDEVRHSKIRFLRLDLLDFESVYQAAESFIAKEEKLHILVNNAGIMNPPFELTKDGYELQIQTNYLSHYLFTELLLPTLRRTAEECRPGDVRIVHVASIAYLQAPYSGIYFPDLNLPHVLLGTFARYGQSKYAQILYSIALAKRLEKYGIYSVSLHPGVIRTELTRYSPTFALKLLEKSVFQYLLLDPIRGAMTSLYAATSPEISKEHLNGAYFTAIAQRGILHRAHDDAFVEELYRYTHKIFEDLKYLAPSP